MNNYVAYHSTEVMGYAYGQGKGTGEFGFLSRKSRTYLEKAIGCDVWVVTGTRDKARKMIYRLAAVYQPDAVRDYGDGFQIVGKRGRSFTPPVVLNDLPWFQTLLREQNRFSFGFSNIQSKVVIAALGGLAGGKTPYPQVTMRKSTHQPTVLFSRSGFDVHGDSFEHRLLYAERTGKWKAWVWSQSVDSKGKKSIEEWDTATDADGFFRLLVENLYLLFSREEVAQVVIPALRKLNPDLAGDVATRMTQKGIEFPGD